MKKKQVLKLLEDMKNAVNKLPEDARYSRFFLADDGAGIILESEIEAAALGKTVEKVDEASNESWDYLRFRIGTIGVYECRRKQGGKT